MKKRIIISTLAMFAASGSIFAQNSLTVNITNLKPGKGTVEIGLFNKENGFLKNGQQFLQKKIKAMGNSVQYTFENLPVGNYAIAVYQDENNNRKCDTNLIGIPTEGFGFSNNFRPKLSAPNFNQTKVFVQNAKQITIKLIQ